MKPFAAAIKGAGEIGFTIISISISLIAVLIPLLLMSGIIGRLFREFAVTHRHDDRRLGAGRADADADDGLALPQSARRGEARPALQAHRARLRRAWRTATRAGSTSALRHSFITLMIFLATVAATGYLFVMIPKGFFPQQDTGIIFGITEAAQDVSFPAMYKLQEQVGRDRPGRSRRRHHGDGPRHRHRQRLAELRPHVHHAEAARGARRRRVPGDRAAAAASSPR